MQAPEFDFPEGPAPTELVIEDLQVGDGTEAGPGQTVTVHYAGIDFETGEQFDSSCMALQVVVTDFLEKLSSSSSIF